MDEIQKFAREVEQNIQGLAEDQELQQLSRVWTREVARHKWSYNFAWMGRPAIQFPNDAWAMQELIWQVKPDLIIEAGIAHGGSLVYYASLLAMLDMCEAVESGVACDPAKTRRKVLGLDIDIRSHNRVAIENHPMANWIQMIEGSSVAPETIAKVADIAKGYRRILVSLDSNHTHEHVLAELKAYAPLVTAGSYCVVFDTIVDEMPAELSANRPWGPGNNPKTAVREYLAQHPEFEIDADIHHKLLITVAPDGYLKRIA
ncbi:cephalosporin hydroxylase [Chromobacterium alkanivorans]|uniref:cephalosporin hydroxylase family protein n=1 Tax=Chromobacterium alkanivorans TaxID=1071719 RepID=UPI002169E036|nr:cephalosporin hydroxylase family protein [Chromobacterium alkanivorans]MCS3802500.1 cephalosporin hydroxylase [Chromobacterium alkanivorans]MCS3816826.1 cephalosporin hydroxylase [Chromobacterium alkanivorans]MCS3871866.1 cephalosporin hydroxylase [Chromobacterium alkanivorans]